jgi:RNA polymerase sigma-70 factor (ECF subfamily)
MEGNLEYSEELMQKYADKLYRIALVLLANQHDAEDAVQETFLRFLKKQPDFNNDEHEKAWFIKVTTNICKDMRRFYFRHPVCDMSECFDYSVEEQSGELLSELIQLSTKYKLPIYLHYIEGYSVKEISNLTHCSEHAVKKQLQRGREVLRIRYEKLD